MENLKEINFTEKLLNVIRRVGQTPEEIVIPQNPPEERIITHATHSRTVKMFRSKTNITLGVNIENDCIRFIKTERFGDKFKILDCQNASFPVGTPLDSPEFIKLLRSKLTLFCGENPNLYIWTLVPAVYVDIRHIMIPKVSEENLETAVLWSAKKEFAFDEKETVIDFEVHKEVWDKNISKLYVTVWTASVKEIEKIKNIFSMAGVQLAGITTATFATQNLVKSHLFNSPDGSIATLFVKKDYSQIDIFAKNNLAMTRDIKSGNDSMVESIINSFGSSRGLTLTEEDVKTIISNSGADKIANLEKFGIKNNDEIFQSIIPPLERLTRQIEKTLEYNFATLGNEKVNKIYIFGNTDIIEISAQIPNYISSQLGISVEILDRGKRKALFICKCFSSAPDSERIACISTIGLALSDKSLTPNLFFTYKDKKKEKTIKRINNRIFTAFIGIVFICSAVYIYQGFQLGRKKTAITSFEKDLSQYGTVINQDMLFKMANFAEMKNKETEEYAKRYMGIAVIKEISSLTPAGIHLKSLKIINGTLSEQANNKDLSKDLKEKRVEAVLIDGLTSGDQITAESALHAYITKLETSMIFKQITIQRSEFVSLKNKAELSFTINLKIG